MPNFITLMYYTRWWYKFLHINTNKGIRHALRISTLNRVIAYPMTQVNRSKNKVLQTLKQTLKNGDQICTYQWYLNAITTGWALKTANCERRNKIIWLTLCSEFLTLVAVFAQLDGSRFSLIAFSTSSKNKAVEISDTHWAWYLFLIHIKLRKYFKNLSTFNCPNFINLRITLPNWMIMQGSYKLFCCEMPIIFWTKENYICNFKRRIMVLI